MFLCLCISAENNNSNGDKGKPIHAHTWEKQ